ncbi:hypothetical protein IV203_031682 [Nitzschia inconspicua]|uniref:Uncharacterized protein n=1 Tax=Nitzschia inconspicua TaxID=303405 RepID=A0A9K3Q5A8_9STRA|nr:hypothetical protein IV203_031682 [Nitzschia inconspicua]
MNRSSFEDNSPQQLTTPTNARFNTKGETIQFSDGRIDELGARTSQNHERRDFLHCGKRPRKGQRTETIVKLENQVGKLEPRVTPHIRLSGIVTQVGVLPSFSDWIMGDNFCRRLPTCGHCELRHLQNYEKAHFQFPRACPDPDCYTNRASLNNTRSYMQTMMARTLLLHGTLHNQEVVSYAHLANDSWHASSTKYDSMQLPFRPGQVYKISLVAQDSSPVFVWKVKSIENVTILERFEDLPEEFRDFAFGMSSPTSPSYSQTFSDYSFDDSELQQFLNDLHNEKMDMGHSSQLT